MFRVGRNQNVRADIHAGTGTLLERDDGQAIQEVIQDLLALRGGLRRDAVADLRSKA